MRKSILIPFILPAALVFSCQTKELDSPSCIEVNQLTATLLTDTKTTLQDETKVFWLPGDKISVFTGDETALFTSTNSSPAAVAQFTGSISVVTGSDSISPERYIWGLYPYRDDATMDEGVITTTLPSEQVAVPGTFDDDLLITIGRATGFSIPFYQVCGGLCFSVSSGGVKRVTISAIDAEPLAGSFQTTFGEDGKPIVTNVVEGKSSITIAPLNNESFIPGVLYFAVLLPGEMKSGMTLTFETSGTSATRVIGKQITLKRGIFSRLTDADYGLEYTSTLAPTLSFADESKSIYIPTLSYHPLSFPSGTAKDHVTAGISDEKAQYSASSRFISLPVVFRYQIDNPERFPKVLSKYDVKFSIKRSPGSSSDFSVNPEDVSLEGNLLSVSARVSGLGDGSTVSLRVPLVDDSIIESDAVTILTSYLDQIRIASQKAVTAAYNQHYRRAAVGINAKDNEALKPALNSSAILKDYEVNLFDANLLELQKSCDDFCTYDGSLNLMKIVRAHFEPAHSVLTDAQLNELGLKWQFDVVRNYKTGSPATLQENYVSFDPTTSQVWNKIVTPGEDVIFYPRAFAAQNSYNAVGKTPVIRVSLLDGSNIVECAYIKVFISESATVPSEIWTRNVDFVYPTDYDGSLGASGLAYYCDPSQYTLRTSIKALSDKLYTVDNSSKREFHAPDGKYTFTDVIDSSDLGTVDQIVISQDAATGTTYALEWTISADDLYAIATSITSGTKAIKNVVSYTDASGNKYICTLNAAVAAFGTTFNMIASEVNYMVNFWNNEGGKWVSTNWNVRVPEFGETNNANCTFINNINASFVTDAAGRTILKNANGTTNTNISDIEFFFCKTHNNRTIAKIGSDFNKVTGVSTRVSADGLTLEAQIAGIAGGWQPVAIINNSGTTPQTWNTITYQENTVAQKLLNTGEFFAYLGAKGKLCANVAGATTREATITFGEDKEDHFKGLFIRPVNLSNSANAYFIDARDRGEEHTYAFIEDIISPMDWRGRAFKPTYPNYWEYYGPFISYIDRTGIRCDINNSTTLVDLPPYIDIQLIAAGTAFSIQGIDIVSAADNKYGIITYYNNGPQVVNDYNLHVPITVSYRWGEITQLITIPVMKYF